MTSRRTERRRKNKNATEMRLKGYFSNSFRLFKHSYGEFNQQRKVLLIEESRALLTRRRWSIQLFMERERANVSLDKMIQRTFGLNRKNSFLSCVLFVVELSLTTGKVVLNSTEFISRQTATEQGG